MNIVFDFTDDRAMQGLTAGQPLAVMPASLATKLLEMYAQHLVLSTDEHIIKKHTDELRECKTVEQAIRVSIDFIATRTLISNISNGNWDAYKVDPNDLNQ
jgi:hypothetical protein